MGGKEQLDSAIFYYKKAIEAGGEEKYVIDAMISLIQAYHEKSDKSSSPRRSKEYSDLAKAVLYDLDGLKVEKGEMFVLQKLVYDNDHNWWYNKERKKVYRITD
jgi:hypothetical protein